MKPIKVHPLAKIILHRFSRLSFKPETFSLGCKVEQSKNVLICMPTDIDRFAMARDLLSTFADTFREKEVYILLPFLDAKGYLSDSSDYRVICIQKEDLNVFSLPDKDFIERLKRFQFSVSLDLDLEHGYFNGHLCLKCKIPLRIGSIKRDSFPFYNIQLAVMKERMSSREIYEGMMQTLKNLFSTLNQTINSDT